MIEAIVQAGAVETTYYRAGQGATVILLRANRTGLAQDPYFQELQAQFRVIAPQCPTVCTATWLRDLIDGLGLHEPALVIDRELVTSASLAAAEISRIAVVQGGRSTAHTTLFRDAVVPVLELPENESGPAIEALLQFLRRETR